DEEHLARIFEVRTACDEQLRRVVGPAAERARARVVEEARRERSAKHGARIARPPAPGSNLEDFARKHVREGCSCSLCRARADEHRARALARIAAANVHQAHAMATRPAWSRFSTACSTLPAGRDTRRVGARDKRGSAPA